MAPVVVLTETVPLAGPEPAILRTVEFFNPVPEYPGLSFNRVFNTTALSIMVMATSLLATGLEVVEFGSNTVIVSVSVGQGGLTPGAQTGTA